MLPSGATVSPTPPAPSFASTRSFNFDGVDNYMTAPIPVDAFKVATIRSFSFWVKINTLNTFTPLFSDTSNSGSLFRRSNGFGVQSGRLRWALESLNVSNAVYIDTEKVDGTGTAPNIGDGNWHHVAVYNSVDSHTNKANIVNSKIYLDGNKLTNFTVNNGSASVRGMTGGNIAFGGGNTNGFSAQVYLDGLIDEFAYFTNYELTDSDVTAIYGTGVPNNLNDLSTPPTAWYRCGENANYKSPQWLMPENSNFANSRFSNYSFEFDGVDDFINTNFILDVTSNFSVSAWINVDSPTNTKYHILGTREEATSASTSKGFTFQLNSSREVHARIFTTTSNITQVNAGVVTSGTWANVALTYVASSKTLKIFLNGTEVGSTTGTAAGVTSPDGMGIGRVATGGSYSYFDGKIDEVSVFNTALSSSEVSSIYGIGVPSTISGAVAHWRMGEEATFSTNWTIPDQVGSSDGISSNVTIEDRVGDAPNSDNNAVSFNMVEADRETDVPT